MKTTRRWVTAGYVSMMILTGFTGCTKTEETLQQTEQQTEQQTQEGSDSQADTGKEAESQTTLPERTDNETISPSEGTEHLGGKVQSVADDGMILAQTTVMGEGENENMVTLVDEKDAKKISVVFTPDTKVEHWVIQGGGAGIDMTDAALLDIKPGQGVELEGYYEGENFVAARILIEEYK